MRRVAAIGIAVVLVACSNDDTASTSTTTPPTTIATTDEGIQAVIDIGGGEAFGLTVDATAVWAVSFETSTLVKIDPAMNAVLDVVDIEGSAASALAVGRDIWIAGYGSAANTNLYRVDAASATLTARYGVGELCCDLSTGDGFLWAIDPTGFLLQVDATTGELVQRIAITIDRNAHTNVVYADGFVWFASDTTPLSRLDPTAKTVAVVDVGGVPFLARDGLLWGASPIEVWAVDSSGSVVERVQLIDSIEVMSLELTATDLWVGIRHPGHVGAVLQIDRATGNVLNEFAIDIPARMIAAFGSLWVTDSGSSNVYRLGPLL